MLRNYLHVYEFSGNNDPWSEFADFEKKLSSISEGPKNLCM